MEMPPVSAPPAEAALSHQGALAGSVSAASVGAPEHSSSDCASAPPAVSGSSHVSPSASAASTPNDSSQDASAPALPEGGPGASVSEAPGLDSLTPGRAPPPLSAAGYVMTGPLPGLPRPRTETVVLDPSSAVPPLTVGSAASGLQSSTPLAVEGARAAAGTGASGRGSWPSGAGCAPQRTLVTVPSVCGSRQRFMHALLQRSAAWMMFSKGVQSVEPQCLEYVSSWLAYRIGAIGRQAKIYANIRGTSVANYFDVKQALFDVSPSSYAALFRTTGIAPVAGTQPKEVLLGADGRGRRARQALASRGGERGACMPLLETAEEEPVVTTDDTWMYRRLLGEPVDPIGAEEPGAVGVPALASGSTALDAPHDPQGPVGRGDDALRGLGGQSQRGVPLGPGAHGIGLFPGTASPPDAAVGASGAGPGLVPGGPHAPAGPDLSGSGSPAVGPAAGSGAALPGASYPDGAPSRGLGGAGGPGGKVGPSRSAEPPLHVPPWFPQFPPAHLWTCTPTPSPPASDGASLDFKRQCAKMELQLHLPQLQLPQMPPSRWDEASGEWRELGEDEAAAEAGGGAEDSCRPGMKRRRGKEDGETADLTLWGLPRGEVSRRALSLEADDAVDKEDADAGAAGDEERGESRREKGNEFGKGKRRRRQDEVIEREVVADTAQDGHQGNLLLSW
ncbi:conserved hypothetical protein [Neospora caninum Liverpool]|uniref:Transcription initiation factor TFIID complex subunit TAF8 n=1 Tax=Neospora caninum (strain Liverpool) TaxID=572307 RepID=F0VNI6_NEOCL|nr:conserved hypothetical protein [Neospora caninum Liverpool]CBZ55282.1 conserved hypothetical protein [Neospora caninum Liverpool]CEL70013.1 TPA: transcription initiation factor TFIID complex subunit TAF8 [Neospora caninum Liverpool]|eukprot:XP_003885310.1 conserved hypothetical protein [Neospora caninum Liverpool]